MEVMDILLIESKATSAYTIQSMLDANKDLFNKEWIYSLSEAVEKLGDKSYNCILTNIILSEAGGKEIIEQLVTRAPNIPIIAIIEKGDWKIGNEMLASGAQDFLIKDELSPALLRKSIYYAIERNRLNGDIKNLTIKDDLTKLYNRRGFNDLAKQLLKMAQRNKRSATLLFIDLDNLKQINDTLGHPVGDLAICEMADILRDLLRTSDVIARLGGDEFVVLAPDTRNGSVINIIDRLRKMLSDRNKPESSYELDASIGIVTYEGEGNVNITNMIKEGCERMYREKNAKKNKVSETKG